MKTAADYVAAATVLAEAPPAAGAAPEVPVHTEAAPEGSTAPVETSEAAPATGEEKVVAPPAKTEEKPDRVAKSLADVAQAKAELRKEREAMAAEFGGAKELIAAKKSGSAMAVLAANGISWKQAAEEVLRGGAGPAAKKPAEAADDESPLAKEVAELRTKLATREANESRAKTTADINAMAKDNPKFRHIAGLEAADKVIAYITKYHEQTGEFPGSNYQETLEIAAEAVEGHLAKEAARYAKVLQPAAAPATNAVKSDVPAAEATSQQAKTLTSSTGSGPKTAPVASKKPKTAEEYQQAALAALTAQ